MGRNLAALVTGAVAMYFMPGGPDGRINGIVVSIRRPTGEDLATASQLDLLKSMPLQSTAHQLVESMATSLRQQGIGAAELVGCKVSLSLFRDPAMHGTVAGADLRGIDPQRRALLLNHNGRVSWSFDPAKTPEALAGRSPGVAAHGRTGTDADFQPGDDHESAGGARRSGARPLPAPSVRPPAVAGNFLSGRSRRTGAYGRRACWPASRECRQPARP